MTNQLDREKLGKIAWEAYRKSLNTTTDDNLPAWERVDHETALAFKDAAEAVWKTENE